MSTNSNRSGGTGNKDRNLRHEPTPGMPLADMSFLAILFANLILIPMALFAMGEEQGAVASIKYLIVGFAAAGAAFGVNKFSVDRLAPLHAVGYRMAGVLAIVAILLTGSGTALGSFTGIVFKLVEVTTYQAAGREMTNFTDDANQVALVAERLGPATEAVSEGIAQTAVCEKRSSCLSGRGNGGRGPMSRALEASSSTALGIAQALQAGLQERDRLLEELNRLNADYAEVLADGARSMADRRVELQALHAEVRQGVSALMEAMPVSVLRGYVGDLQSGATIPGNPSGSRILSAYLRRHGDALAEQLDNLPDAELIAPAFPDRPGMIDVLRFLPTYLAIAAIVIVGELILPITIYLMTYFRIDREIEILEGACEVASTPDPLLGLIDHSGDQGNGGSSS
ncbi:hypothetical protein [Pseudophaeobacter sp.]|uniref:hypothetical protein n=1 Tax=Pseudophaeobacter sp. TaxID=1971739 RepID=UPI002610B6F2|nr:hypothetical protein [Pseudophaeobacter sp.]